MLRRRDRAGARGGRRWADLLAFVGPGLVLAVAGFALAYQFVEPAPPDSLRMATGMPGGAYQGFGERYREFLARYGVELELVPTEGSADNLRLLSEGPGGVDAAFVQGGTPGVAETAGLGSLGSLFYEPLWIFHRAGPASRDLADLAPGPLAVGAPGSGTRALALALLGEAGLRGEVDLVDIGGAGAADALVEGRVRAGIFVLSPSAPLLERLLGAPGIDLLDLERAEAYARRLGYLSPLVLPKGVLDLARDQPAADTTLLAATANLVVREDLHPALIELLMQAARHIHGGQDLLAGRGAFPVADDLVLPLHPEARRHYEHGPPLLQRYLPFWAAIFVDRMKVMLVPLLALLLPLAKLMPPLYRWRMHARIYRWYREIGAVERRAQVPVEGGPSMDPLDELNRIEGEVVKLNVPLSFADEVYDLRIHIALVRDRLRELAARVAEER